MWVCCRLVVLLVYVMFLRFEDYFGEEDDIKFQVFFFLSKLIFQNYNNLIFVYGVYY